ncbi:TetR family transcriptional regulator [Thermus scotoductus]|uniref:TetR family transcriptional regulator n=2 Tax=Thermus scotoductus TaxID=37636 RepID=A0A430SGU5_THESC|nr:TetR family transcriptional regulator [Thermus scotoductus]RTH04244.1 TetR family transcriptional regulator [Thermus scotoductus]RTH23452.1 TetR family transcriptional regulator [Thermus scotoductus]RTH38929.1 TetR family transcriptional regulator [Thermus scotoductus]RTI01546.1 TetR family transcriptional regulator [Thermus scotoductus]
MDPSERLLLAALELLAERGYRGATTKEIARRVGVNEVTLFRRFGSKEALLRAALSRFIPAGFLERLPAEEAPLEEGLRQLLEAYLDLLKAHQALLPKLLAELLRHPGLRGAGPPKGILGVLERVVGFFRAQQRKGLLRSDEPPEEMALAFVGPLMARFLLGEALGVRLPLDKAAYLRGYLEGRYGAGRGGQSELR